MLLSFVFGRKSLMYCSRKRTKKGNRLFTAADVENLRIIYHLVKERGFTLQGAKSKLKENKSDVVDTAEVYDALVKVTGILNRIER
jgi:DNA-binding transcriptional MerR regulator